MRVKLSELLDAIGETIESVTVDTNHPLTVSEKTNKAGEVTSRTASFCAYGRIATIAIDGEEYGISIGVFRDARDNEHAVRRSTRPVIEFSGSDSSESVQESHRSGPVRTVKTSPSRTASSRPVRP